MSTMEEHEREQDEITARYDAMHGRGDDHEDEEEGDDSEEVEEQEQDEEERIELFATVNGVELYGSHPMNPHRLKDQDSMESIYDLISEIPEGRDGQVVEVVDAKGKLRGTLVHTEGEWDWENAPRIGRF